MCGHPPFEGEADDRGIRDLYLSAGPKYDAPASLDLPSASRLLNGNDLSFYFLLQIGPICKLLLRFWMCSRMGSLLKHAYRVSIGISLQDIMQDSH